MSLHETLHVPAESGDALAQRYEAVTAAAAVVAGIAGVEPETDVFADVLAHTQGRKANRAADIVADMAAILEPGIATLLAVSSRGADAGPAARALRDEYDMHRNQLARLLEREPASI